MARIRQLDAHLTNMIAAGEVVERPMGVIKELVENAIDAKATRIEIQIAQGGIESMEVTDNGIGMDREDACLCFERHATSKIHSAEDLWAIGTLGFRGEALPSIASVSHLTLLTNNGEESTRVEVRYGQRQSARPYPCNRGTQVSVSGLFQKTPARLKHLKSVPYESSLILDVVQKFALSYPAIAFRLIHDGKEVFRTSGNGSLQEVIAAVYGRQLARQCIDVRGEDMDYRIYGMIALPSQTRASRNYMTVFINERMIRSYRIQKAILAAYQEYIPAERYPLAVLDIRMDSHLCDVNVHPSKWEVRLSKEQQLEYLIRQTLSETLRTHMQAPQVTLSRTEEKVEIQSLFEAQDSQREQVREDSVAAQHWKQHQQIASALPPASASPHASPLPSVSEQTTVAGSLSEEQEQTLQPVRPQRFPQMQVLAQMHGRYILAQDEQALYIIDQHAAQERVHFEEVEDRFAQPHPQMQTLLVPIVLEGSGAVVSRLPQINEVLAPMSIQLESFGQDTLICRQLPSWMSEIDEQAFLQDVIDLWKEGREVRAQDLQRHRLATIACHHSIRFNRVLSLEEMQQVIEQLARCRQPYHCPHGRPTFITITEKQLIREFQR